MVFDVGGVDCGATQLRGRRERVLRHRREGGGEGGEEEAEMLEAEVEEAAVGSGHGGSTVTMVP